MLFQHVQLIKISAEGGHVSKLIALTSLVNKVVFVFPGQLVKVALHKSFGHSLLIV